MLGEVVLKSNGGLEEIGKLDNEHVSYEGKSSGLFLEEECSVVFTAEREDRADGTICGKIQGALAMAAGSKIPWEGLYNGVASPDGATKIRGVLCLSTYASGKHSLLNKNAVAFEMDADAEHSFTLKGWFWE